ncbi:hypothetical protein [Ethanoligenens harbinense]|uniref:hypothetical protein n=1 Tax=Ethanoligenens harbinense TaxID=253239 RepID=UPI0002FCA1D3|nr:hypothetical protein [Ethanoligenens harbinense]AVQ94929.1 hypothetical protein CXQ68_00885 [Ethanoligenens harbinense YUAN-3]AYF37621.1 hypothetical protein CXP51_00890 [Ethanoligenens harbinense]AYF40341.1 hypothetical protein CN246_00885 [Ethanoligenens harbinense]QCN91177.1 hypothetical protein DRA42_00900 [Ethanoligenens harbinense]
MFVVKGVERKIIEIRDNGSGCFERALFFVRADVPSPLAEPTLAGEAARIIERFCRAKKGGRRPFRALFLMAMRYAACAAGGAGAATLFWLLGGGHF